MGLNGLLQEELYLLPSCVYSNVFKHETLKKKKGGVSKTVMLSSRLFTCVDLHPHRLVGFSQKQYSGRDNKRNIYFNDHTNV
jgi:hypothetical protein